jgi:flagellar biosynthesis/type III secretory pathway protein FliH
MFSSEPRVFVALAGAASSAEFAPLPLACGSASAPAAARGSSAGSPAATSVEQRIAEAFEQGRMLGATQQRAEFAAEAGATLARIEQALADARDADLAALAELGRGSLDVAAAIAERVLGALASSEIARLAPCLEEALRALPPAAARSLALAPEDLASLRAGGAEALAGFAERNALALRADATLARGELLLESGAASLELRWQSIVERIRAAAEHSACELEAAS